MSFKMKEKEPKPGQDCKDFKPMFWRRGYCKLSDKCDDTYKYNVYGYGYCSGVLNTLFKKKGDDKNAKSNGKIC